MEGKTGSGGRPLRRDNEPSFAVPGQHERLHRSCVALFLSTVDRFWADHLAAVEDLREGIHLQRYGGREPLYEFIRLGSEAFAAGWQGVLDECAAAFRAANRHRLNASETSRRPASTWTYALDDEGLPVFSVAGFGGGFTIGVFAAVARATAEGVRRLWSHAGKRDNG